jgi:hypothetical protein
MRRLTPREGPKLVNEMRRLMKGVMFVTGEGFPTNDSRFFPMPSDDSRYRKPMSQENALVAACMNLGIPFESAREHLKLCRFTADARLDDPPAPSTGKGQQHFDRIKQARDRAHRIIDANEAMRQSEEKPDP